MRMKDGDPKDLFGAIEEIAQRMEKKGHLFRYAHHETGEEIWELTPEGREHHNLPPISQH